MLIFIAVILLVQTENTDLEQVNRWIYEGNTEKAKAWLSDKTQNPNTAAGAHVELLMNLHHQDMNFGAIAELYSRFEDVTKANPVKSFFSWECAASAG